MGLIKPKNNFEIPVSSLVGSSYSNFRKVAARHRFDRPYRTKYRLTKAFSWILDLFSLAEQKKYQASTDAFQIKEPPIFIVGFWRSGTTLLHSLLSTNPYFGYVSTFHAVFPNHTLMHQWWLKSLARLLIPERRPADNVRLDLEYPQEEDIALGNMQSISFYYFLYFPDEFDEFVRESLLFEGITDEDMKRWREAYTRLVKTALINTGGQRFISKNPPNAFRIKQLLELFPGAKFISIKRSHYNTISSFQRFVHPVMDGIKLQDYDREAVDLNLIKLYKLYREKYEEDKLLMPEGSLVEIGYEEVLQDKIAGARSIYQGLGIPGFEEALPYMEKYLAENEGFKPGSYSISEENIRKIDEILG